MTTIKKPIIYALAEPNSDVIRYVGQTIDLKQRLSAHYTPIRLVQRTHHNDWIKSLKTKDQKADVIILQEASNEDELNQLEIMWIAYCRALGFDLTNGTDGGDGAQRGRSISEEHKKKISIALKGRPCTEEQKIQISIANSGERNGMFGKTISESTRQKISLSRKGLKMRPCSEEHKRKISLANTGRKFTEEHKRKLSEIAKGRPGKKLSEETKRKIGAASSGRKHTEEAKRKMSEAAKGRTGRKFSKEHKRKISEARIRYLHENNKGT